MSTHPGGFDPAAFPEPLGLSRCIRAELSCL